MIRGFVHFHSGIPKEKWARNRVSTVLKIKFRRNVTDWESQYNKSMKTLPEWI